MKKKLSNTKNKINKVALDLFIKKGIKGTTTREIAEKAKIAEGTIYRHFKSKNNIAFELFNNYMNDFMEKISVESNSLVNPRLKLESIIDAFFDFAKKEPKACFYIVIGHYTELGNLSKKKQDLKNIFAGVISEGIKKKEFRTIDESLGAALIIGMINRAILFYNNGLLNSNYEGIIFETKKSALRILEKK